MLKMLLGYIKFYQTKGKLITCATKNEWQIKNILRSRLRLSENVANRILHQYPTLTRTDPEQMLDSINRLKTMDLSPAEIAAYPLILHRNDYILNDNSRLLAEIGLTTVTAYRLHNIQHILNTSVQFNEQFNFLPRNINIFEHIFDVAKVDIAIGNNLQYNPSDSLLKIHTIALVYYLQQRLHLTNEKVAAAISRNVISNGRSIRGIEQSVMTVEKTTKEPITAETIQTYCLTLFPEQIKTIFSLKTIYGIDIQELLCSRHNYSHFPIEKCVKAAEVLQRYNVPEHIVRRHVSLLFRNPRDLADDLDLISSIDTDRKYFAHVHFSSLVMCIKRLKVNMEQQKINFYKTVDDRFLDFFLNGYLFKNYSQALPYFRCIFNVTEDEARKAICSHPQWNKINLAVIHKNIEYLLSLGFTHVDIFRDAHVVLYSLFEITDILRKINDPTEANRLGIPTDLTNSQKLRLTVYFIEQKCGFNGKGVFVSTDRTEYEDSESAGMEAIIKSCLKNGSNINLHNYVYDDEVLINSLDE